MGQFKQLAIQFEDSENSIESEVNHIMETENTDTIPVDLVAQFVGALTTKKLHHNQLVLTGIADRCVRCGMELTDSLSLETSIGPYCRGKGYNDEGVKEGADEMGAMIALAEFPEVCQFLIEKFRPLGLRKLMNGIVRCAALNRNNTKLHAACADAIEALGWVRLANTLRESICIVVIKHSTKHPGCIEVHMKRHAYKYGWAQDMKQIQGVFYDRALSRFIVPIKNPVDDSVLTCMFEGKPMSRRSAFLSTLVRWYPNEHGRTVGGSGFKIVPKDKPSCQV